VLVNHTVGQLNARQVHPEDPVKVKLVVVALLLGVLVTHMDLFAMVNSAPRSLSAIASVKARCAGAPRAPG